MIFRVTQKLARKIKAAPTTALPPHDNPLLDWAANLFLVSRWQCILLTNSRSLYSVVLLGKGIPSEKAFVEQGMKALRENMALEGIVSIFDTKMASFLDSISFCKCGGRRVVGSMNELVFQAKCDLIEMGHPLPLVNYRLNGIPMSNLNYRYSVEEIVALCS